MAAMAALQTASGIPSGYPLWAVVVAGLGGALVVTLLVLLRLRLAHRAERALLHPFSDAARRVPVYLRGLFVPGGEFFSRAPEDPRNPSSGVTVHKWTRIPEVFSAPDVQAAATVLRLLTSENPEVTTGLLAGDAGRQTWSDDAIAIGPHYLTLQVLDGCEPRLVALRQPAAFRLLPSGQVLEAKEGLDFGLVYKGVRAATHRTFMVVMGLGDAGTVAAARFLELHAAELGRLMGRAPFAAIIGVDPARGAESAQLRALEPRPGWLRRMLAGKAARQLLK